MRDFIHRYIINHSHHPCRQYVRSLHVKDASPVTRVRFAPSPTGYLHLGGLRTALFNYLFARRNKGQFIMRLEDTDRTRFVPGATEDIIGTLENLGLHFDEGTSAGGNSGPYVQSERLSIYKKYINQLLEQKKAYHCFCPPVKSQDEKAPEDICGRKCASLGQDIIEEKLRNNEPHTIKFLNPHNASHELDDQIYGRIQFSNQEALNQDFILQKTDGLPTYHFANVVDDHDMGITHVIRGEEWLSSTPKHLALYKAFGFEHPKFAHLPSLMNEAGAKLSKRDPKSGIWRKVSDLKDYEPEAIVNFVALLGWRPSLDTRGLHELDQDDIFTLSELEELFSLEDVNRNRPRLGSTEKLDWINKMHIRKKMSAEDGLNDIACKFSKILQHVHNIEPCPSIDYIKKALIEVQGNVVTLKQAANEFLYYFQSPTLFNIDEIHHISKKSHLDILQRLRNEIYQSKDLMKDLKNIVKNVDEPSKTVWLVLRHALTGQAQGPSLAKLVSVLGNEETCKRLDTVISLLKKNQ